jgi:type II secretory pathway pseudopilin PulG
VRSRAASEHGYSLIELLVATLLVTLVSLMVLAVVSHGFRVARAQPEAGDLHQRLRVAAEMMKGDLRQAGAGLIHGPSSGALAHWLPPVVPARTGALSPDPDLSAFADRLTVLYVPDGGWRASLAADLVDPAAAVPIDPATSQCPAAGLCGFVEGTRAALVDPSAPGAGYDLFTVTGLSGGLQRGAPNPLLARAYPASTALVVPIVQRVYYLNRSERRLMVYDGYMSDLPLVDHVADLSFTYFGSPSPYDVVRPPEGESSCLFGLPSPAPLLAEHPGSAPRVVGLAELQDGPLCGTGSGAFDGDLLRLRSVRVRIRLEAGADDLRAGGPAYSRPGRSQGGVAAVQDYEVSFDVALQNLWPLR